MQQIEHIGIAVKDLEVSNAIFAAVLEYTKPQTVARNLMETTSKIALKVWNL